MKIVSFESRLALKIEKLIEKQGGQALVAPSMKEIPLADHAEVFEFFEKIAAGEFDFLILFTGVATRTFLEILQTKISKEKILQGLAKTKIVVRGPKPTTVCNIWGIPIAYTAPQPNTWQEIINILQADNLLQNKTVGVLEYGNRNFPFIRELETMGAKVLPLKVYQWGFPDDLTPLNKAIDEMIAEKVDLILFTSANQADNFLEIARSRHLELPLRRALAKTAIFSIGPFCSERLRELQIFADYEVSPNKMEDLVEAAFKHGPMLVKKKNQRAKHAWAKVEDCFKISQAKELLQNSHLLKACRLEKTDTIPIWLMRQAGRYMAEYQLQRKGTSFLEFCKNPQICMDATITAVERLGVDAAIIFSDILLILEPMGLKLDFKETGPLIENPIRDLAAIEKLSPPMIEESLGFVLEAIRLTRKNLHPRIPLIGFCGAPFTLASYMIEGKGSKNFIPTKMIMHSNPETWHLLMEKLVAALSDYLSAQVTAGCQVLQIFDSWVGCLSPQDFEKFVLPHTQKLIAQLPKNIPVIYFGVNTQALLPYFTKLGCQVIGLDWHANLNQLSPGYEKICIQGNLDPVLLFSKPKDFLPEVERILKSAGNRPGFIFNLGHGILPETPVDHVLALVDYVHEWKGT